MAAVFGLLVGLPALRLRGDYLAIVTLACGEIIKNIITNLDFTGGALGLNTNPIYSNAKKLLPYAVILVLLTVLVMMNLKRSKQGRAIMAIVWAGHIVYFGFKVQTITQQEADDAMAQALEE